MQQSNASLCFRLLCRNFSILRLIFNVCLQEFSQTWAFSMSHVVFSVFFFHDTSYISTEWQQLSFKLPWHPSTFSLRDHFGMNGWFSLHDPLSQWCHCDCQEVTDVGFKCQEQPARQTPGIHPVLSARFCCCSSAWITDLHLMDPIGFLLKSDQAITSTITSTITSITTSKYYW